MPTFATSNVSITHIARLAATDHSAQRQSIDDFTDGVGTARMRDITWILALAVEAGQFAGTLGIHGTSLGLNGQQFATHGGITAVSSGTATLGTMVVDTTLSANAAVAWIFTTFISAGEMEGAVVIAAAFRAFATHKRITSIFIGTVTAGTMIEVSATDGASAALRETARIYTLFIDAGLRGSTFSIRTTAEKVTMLERIACVTFITDAERAMELNVATCLLSTQIGLLAGITADLVDTRLIIAAL